MKAVFTEQQTVHYPPHFLVNGVMRPNPEVPGRCERLLLGARQAGCRVIEPGDCGMDPITAIHPQRYIEFLQNAWQRWSYIEGAADVVIPNIHPDNRSGGYPRSVVAQAGFHMADLACPIAHDSWDAIRWSACTAVHAARLVQQGEPTAYALCRPPGHHAFAEVAGGFCFLNNTAIATQQLLDRFSRAAILDVDLHHGNGTQGIFYARDDVLTVSIHAHPERFYPFFWGYENETGEGRGRGFNRNLPLPRGAGDGEFLDALERAFEAIAAFAPDVLVVALGLDAFEGDPFGGLRVSTQGFGRIGSEIRRHFDGPILAVQEGGYLCDELEFNLAAFLQGME
jgi:acetoin utilization deacetylase AcuC-like enzyme